MPSSIRANRFRILLLVAVLTVSGVAATGYLAGLPPSSRELARELQADLGDLRAAIHLCRADLRSGEVEFRDFDREVAILRDRIEEFEALHPDGVPVDSYPRYMEVFEAYNASLPDWRIRADTLQAAWQRCRDLTESHNVLVDSLGRLAEEMGYSAGPSDPSPTLDWPTPSPSPF